MPFHFEVLAKKDLDWLMVIRNFNREWFMDERVIPDLRMQELWFRDSTDKGDLNFVIKHDEDRVGFLSIYSRNAGSANIGRMMIDFKYRRQGYMEKSIIKAFDICKHLGLEQLILEVKKENIPARDLYCKMGFVTFGITHNSLIMRKML